MLDELCVYVSLCLYICIICVCVRVSFLPRFSLVCCFILRKFLSGFLFFGFSV